MEVQSNTERCPKCEQAAWEAWDIENVVSLFCRNHDCDVGTICRVCGTPRHQATGLDLVYCPRCEGRAAEAEAALEAADVDVPHKRLGAMILLQSDDGTVQIEHRFDDRWLIRGDDVEFADGCLAAIQKGLDML